MRLCKKHLALLLALTMLLPLLAVGASASEPAEEALPIDYVYEDVTEAELDTQALKLSFDLFSSLQWDMKMIGMEEAWKTGLTGKNVRVGIVDSGLSNLTMDIDRNRIEEGVNYSPIKINIGSPVMDTVGHGTFIAGIIGATKGNGVGIAGVAPGVTFVPIKCFSSLFTTLDAEVQGIYAAVDDYHCDVINLSSGAPEHNKQLKAAVDYAVSKGVIVISTVGNEGDETLNYPGAYDSVIAVGSVNRNMQVSEFSNRNESVFVVAPGEDVYSLGTLPFTVKKSSGTSFSAPFVSGLAALLRERYPQMNQSDFAEILKMSSRDLGDEGYDTAYGYGLIQAPAAIRAADVYFGNPAPAEPEQPEQPYTPSPSPFAWFSDVLRNSWFYNAVKYVTDHNYMIGVSRDSFAPYGLVTRAQVAQILYNMEGKPAFTGGKAFPDTASSAWYYTPVLWAEQNGLVKGYPNGCFDPDAPVTREQLATILYRYAMWKGLSADTGSTAAPAFPDFASVSDFAKAAMQWATAFGIMKGDDRGLLNPGSSATRAEVATMLMNFDNNVK